VFRWLGVFSALIIVACSDEQKAVLKSKADKVLPVQQKKEEPADGGWSPEKISTDPAGYLTYATAKVGSQIVARRQRLDQLAAQKSDVDKRAENLETKVSDAQNIIKRMKTAAQRADDENNWPVKMAGRAFDLGQSDAVIKSLEQFIADRESLAKAYADARARIRGVESTLSADIKNLEHMKEKIGLDLERVRLNQGLSELGDLQKTETELAAFAKTLADMSDDATLTKLGTLGRQANEALNAETLLR
jgi:phage shock protein A